MFSLSVHPVMDIHIVSTVFNFLRTHLTICHRTALFYISTSSVWGFQVLHILTNTCHYLSLTIANLVEGLFIGQTDVQAETPILWPPDSKKAKSQLAGKDPGAGKDWGQEKGVTEDEMVDGIPVKDREPKCPAVHRITKSGTRLSDWATTANLVDGK